MKYLLYRRIFVLLTSSIGVVFVYTHATSTHAAIVDWQRGASMVPVSSSDFGSSSFQQSLKNLAATGANSVDLVVPYYQSSVYSTDVSSGYNTPTDSALGSAIDYAHSLGLSATLNVHVDPYDGSWRASINPSDRDGWFRAYGAAVSHVAQIAQTHHAELLVIGTELVDMTSDQVNGANTQHWLSLIQQVRGIYSGKLTYSANSNNNNGDTFSDEKRHIGFWSSLDYVGLSVYYQLNTGSNDVQSLMGQWDYWNKYDLQQFQQSVGKPLMFIEAGYRSVSGAHWEPWNWGRSGSVDLTEQANDYQALLQYWNNYSYLSGVYFWKWETDPNAGGSGDSGYTPQNKPAQDVMKNMFNNAPPPPSGGVIGIWWPTDGTNVTGLQPFKALLENTDVSQYNMYWNVDSGSWVPMYTSTQDWPHKEAMVDLSGWHWRGSGPYTITFIATRLDGSVIVQRSVRIWIPQ